MEIYVVSIGKPSIWIQDALKHWKKRILTLGKISHRVIQSSRPWDTFEQFISKFNGKIFLLTRTGNQLNSEEWAIIINEAYVSHSSIAFVVGDAEGFPQKIFDVTENRISFGNATFQHDIALLMTMEQIYRGFSIIHNLPYHRLS